MEKTKVIRMYSFEELEEARKESYDDGYDDGYTEGQSDGYFECDSSHDVG